MDEHPFVGLARDAIRHYAQTRQQLHPKPLPDDPPPAGVFVSLHHKPGPGQAEGALRGCIGTYAPREDNLRAEIARSAVAAAYSDPRFSPLRSDEIDDLEITVYVLGEPERIAGATDLDPARYGVIVEGSGRRGLLLPGIPGIDTAERQLDVALSKAGLAGGDAIDLYRFSAAILR
ncbi:MAG: AmmeMemoRadiSam system protein A [Acidimicrobiia bacterium]|nr:AmmeMemoRadiSam system protein A [Acidimicrobiia bacterium]